MTSTISPLKQREPRHSVMLSATIERFGRVETTLHRVRNLSRTGACIAGAHAFRGGETVVVAVGTVKAVAATVRWSRAELAGLAFANPIDLTAALGADAA